MSERLLAIKNLTVASVTAEGLELDHVSLAIARGETLIVLGEAGCGKEALMDVLGGVPRSVADGTLQFGAAPPQRADLVGEPALRTAYLLGPYARPLSPHASVVSQLSRVIARRTHTPRESARAEFALALARLDGAPPIHVFEKSPAALVPAVLAWGLLAAALAQTPELLLADHPLSGLAPTQARALARALLEEQARAGFSILYSAMGTGAARWLGGRLVIMRHGRIVEEGPVARLTTMQAPSRSYRRPSPKHLCAARRVASRSCKPMQSSWAGARARSSHSRCAAAARSRSSERTARDGALLRKSFLVSSAFSQGGWYSMPSISVCSRTA
jgi:peptide/nickel transport system ATP-binding protein